MNNAAIATNVIIIFKDIGKSPNTYPKTIVIVLPAITPVDAKSNMAQTKHKNKRANGNIIAILFAWVDKSPFSLYETDVSFKTYSVAKADTDKIKQNNTNNE